MGTRSLKRLFLAGFFFVLCLFSFSSQVRAVNFEPVTEAQFLFGGQILRLDSPAVKVGKLIYVPLRDFKDLFRFKMFENPKSGRLELTRITDGLFVSFKQNSDVALLKQNSAVPMQAPMYFLRNTYYVPAKSFFELMGFDLETDSNIFRVFVKINQINLTNDSIEIKGLAPFANQVTPLEKGQGFMVRIEGASWSGQVPAVEAGHTLVKELKVQAWIDEQTQKKKGIQVMVYGKTPLKYVVINEETENAVLIALSKDHYYANTFMTQMVSMTNAVEPVDQPAPVAVKKQMIEKENQPVIKVTTTGEQTFPSLNALWLPDLTGNTGLAFMIKGEKIVKPLYEIKNGVVYLEAKTFLPPVNYRLEVQPDQKTLNVIRLGTVEETVITFDLTNQRLNKKYLLLSPPYQKNGKWYLPVVDTCRHLGLGGRYEKNSNTVFINPRVKEVYVENINGQKKIVIVATDTIFDQRVYEKKDQLIIDLPHTHLDVPSKLLPFDDPAISQIRLGQFEADTVRVVISLKAPLTYGLGSKPSGRALEIGFANWITAINQEKASDGTLQVRIRATAPLKYSQNYYKNPDRFILEFQEAVLKTEPLQLVGQSGVQQIRASQFSYAPLTSRIVFDLNQYQTIKVVEVGDAKELLVIFSAKTTADTPVTPVHDTTVSIYAGAPFNPANYVSLKGKKIVVSAGHGGTDPGSIFGGTEEKVFTLQVSNKIKDLLLKVGAIPLMAREDDQFVSMEDRCRFANGNAADALVDVHFNSFIKEEISGTETYYYKNKDYPLAQKVHQEILKVFNRQDKGLKKAQMYTLNHTQMPGVLVEPLYLSNKEELNIIKEEINQEKLARAILEGLSEYFKNPGVAP